MELGSSSDDNHPWQFLSKFGYGKGVGEYKMRARLTEQWQGSSELTETRNDGFQYLDFDVFLDEQWPQVQTLPSCALRSAEAKKTHAFHMAESGEWSEWETGTVAQNVRPHIWYFVVSNCRQALGTSPFVLEYEIHMTQVDGSEFSVEMRSMLSWNSFVLLCFLPFIAYFCVRCCTFASSAGGLHDVIWVLAAAIAFQFAAQVLHTLHLWRYQSDGIGLHALDLLSEVLFMFSQVVQTTLLIAIAMGFTLLPSRDGCVVVVKWIALLSLAIHAALVGFSKNKDESACKYHENEGAVGWVLLSVRLMLLGWFLVATQSSQQAGGLRLHDFLQRFRLAGVMYFLAYPLLFVLVQVFAAYLQHPILQVGLTLMQTSSVVWLAELFLSRGTYFKVSTLSSSVLPGSHGAGMFDKRS